MEDLTGASPDSAFRRGQWPKFGNLLRLTYRYLIIGVDVPESMEGLTGETPEVAFKRGKCPELWGN